MNQCGKTMTATDNKEPYVSVMNNLLEGFNTELSVKGAKRIKEFLTDNYPDTKLVRLNSGKYYFQE